MVTLSLENEVRHIKLLDTSPLSQFEIKDLLSIDALGNLHVSITNIGFYLTIGGIILLILFLLGQNYNKLVSNN